MPSGSIKQDGIYNDFYPAYAGAVSYAPMMADVAPLQPTLSPTGAGGIQMPQSHHLPLLAWVAIALAGAFLLMHLAEK